MGAPAAAVGAGMMVYGAVKGNNDEQAAAAKDAELKGLQAQEVAYKAAEDVRNTQIDGAKLEGAEVSGYAKGGFEFSGSPLLALEETADRVNREVVDIQHAALFRENQLRAGASATEALAADQGAGRLISTAGGLGMAAARGYSPDNDGTTMTLGDVGVGNWTPGGNAYVGSSGIGNNMTIGNE